MLLYYLTKAEHAKENIRRQRLKVSRIQDLNDPFEVFGVDRSQRPHRAELRQHRNETNASTGLICFTSTWKNPVMWGHYADRHQGMALEFEVNHPSLTQVIYAKTLLELDIDPDRPGRILNKNTKQQLLCTKFHEWKYEREWRMIVRLADCDRNDGLYFWPFEGGLRLRRILIGPHGFEDVSKIRKLVSDFHPHVKVIKTRLAFRSFSVVENKKATRRS